MASQKPRGGFWGDLVGKLSKNFGKLTAGGFVPCDALILARSELLKEIHVSYAIERRRARETRGTLSARGASSMYIYMAVCH